jgi:hypothetical protein
MDGLSRTKILKETKKRYNIELHPNTLSMCELAAHDIVRKLEDQKKRRSSEAIPDLSFRAKLVTDAANAIANENGGAQQANLAIVIFAILMVIIVLYHLDWLRGMNVLETMMKTITSKP